MKCEKKYRCHDGHIEYYQHDSKVTNCPMKFSLYRPDKIKTNKILVWLSGLTCTEENFQIKAGASRFLSEYGMALICPDTSPRNLNIPGENDSYDFGEGAGFYIDASQAPWDKNYKMESYLVNELLDLATKTLKIDEPCEYGISGHSMGGHGALTLGLKYPKMFSSISAFSPILNPTKCPWGIKAFTGYLGSNTELWKEHDFLELLKGTDKVNPIRIDQGLDDEFLVSQLNLQNLEEYLSSKSVNGIEIHKHQGFDHSYYFISSFIQKHIQFHG